MEPNIPITANDRAGNTGNYTLTVVCDNTAPAVTNATLTNPSVGTYLSGGITTNITWNTSFHDSEASPIVNPVSIDYSINSGSTWTPLVTLGVNNGSTSWTIPSADTANALARIVAIDKLGNTATGTVSFIIDSTNPSVSSSSILTPNGGEFLKKVRLAHGISITWNPAVITDTNIATNPISSIIPPTLERLGRVLQPVLPIMEVISGPFQHQSTILQMFESVSWQSIKQDIRHLILPIQISLLIRHFRLSRSILRRLHQPRATLMIRFDISAIGTDTNIDKVYYSFSYGGNTYWNESGSGSWLGIENWNVLCNTPAGCSAVNTSVLPDQS